MGSVKKKKLTDTGFTLVFTKDLEIFLLDGNGHWMVWGCDSIIKSTSGTNVVEYVTVNKSITAEF